MNEIVVRNGYTEYMSGISGPPPPGVQVGDEVDAYMRYL